ncbi:MAG TPA: L,D-transpeptidase [Xanthobacteraceae bacterium]
MFLPNVTARLSWSPGKSVVERGFSLRSGFSVAIVALVLAGSAYGAAAQYYPPPDHPPAPVPIYRDARGVPIDPRYVQPAPGEEVYEAPPVGRPFFPPQPLPVVTGGPIDRPPSDVAAVPGPADVTGSVRGAAPMAPPGNSAAPPRAGSNVIASLPPEDQPEQGPAKELPQRFRRQIVEFSTTEPAGTIIIDTPNTYLYFVLGNGRAIRYGVGVGREGFTWSGTERISRMKEWPDWFPPKEMIERQPYLPRFMAGGETNPLGARALYLGSTVYRIHGTNQPSTIGSFVSSGCIRLANDDIEDLYNRVNIGTHVVVLPGSNPDTAALRPPGAR